MNKIKNDNIIEIILKLKELKRDIDFVDRDSLNDINKKYILKDLIYV